MNQFSLVSNLPPLVGTVAVKVMLLALLGLAVRRLLLNCAPAARHRLLSATIIGVLTLTLA